MGSKKKTRVGPLTLTLLLALTLAETLAGTSNDIAINSINGINGKPSYYASSYLQNPPKFTINRDSYADAASDAGYAAPAVGATGGGGSSVGSSYGAPSSSYGTGDFGGQGQQQMYHYQLIPQASGSHPMSSYGAPVDDYDDDEEEGGGLGGGSELACLAGILGLKKGKKAKGFKAFKALKALKAIKAIKALKGILFFPLFLPLLLPILLPLLIIPLALLLLLPIPIITVPAGGRANEKEHKKVSLVETARMAGDVLSSSECVERISCEVSQFARGYKMDKWIEKTMDKLPKGKTTERMTRAISTESCSKFSCDPVGATRRMLNL